MCVYSLLICSPLCSILTSSLSCSLWTPLLSSSETLASCCLINPSCSLRMQTKCNVVPSSTSHQTSAAAALTGSWAASPPVALAAALTVPPHRQLMRRRERRRPNACGFPSPGSSLRWRARGGCRGGAGVSSGGTTPTGRSLALSGYSLQTGKKEKKHQINEHALLIDRNSPV